MRVIVLRLSVSAKELEILEDIEDVGYGELYDVRAGETRPIKVVSVSERAQNFIKALRREKHFPLVVIHDSEPATAEYPSKTPNGRACKRKIRF
jgi:hypothetical protein